MDSGWRCLKANPLLYFLRYQHEDVRSRCFGDEVVVVELFFIDAQLKVQAGGAPLT